MAKYKILEGGGVWNNEKKIGIPEEPKNSDWIAYQKWVVAGGTPDPVDPVVVTPDMIKAEARRRILAEYSVSDQNNAEHEVLGLYDKRITHIEDASNPALTDKEVARIAELKTKKAWIDSILAKAATLAVSLPADYLDDGHWPASPI